MDQKITPLVDEDNLADLLNVQVKSVQAWRSRGGGPKFIRVGRLVRYSQDDIEAWVASRRMASTSEPAR